MGSLVRHRWSQLAKVQELLFSPRSFGMTRIIVVHSIVHSSRHRICNTLRTDLAVLEVRTTMTGFSYSFFADRYLQLLITTIKSQINLHEAYELGSCPRKVPRHLPLPGPREIRRLISQGSAPLSTLFLPTSYSEIYISPLV